MKTVDRTFGWLLVVSSLLHAFGSYAGYKNEPMTLLWALSGSLAGLLLAALNLLRAGRPGDRPLAAVSLAGCLLWLVIISAFGSIIGNRLDFRVLVQGGITLVLTVFSVLSLTRYSARSAFEGSTPVTRRAGT